MKNKTEFRKQILFILFISILSTGTVYSQNMKIDISYGTGPTFIKVYNKYNFHVYDKVSEGTNTSFYLGLTNKIKGKFFLRTELGFTRIDYHLRIDYDYLGYKYIEKVIKKQVLSLSINNERIYLSILPEFRFTLKKFDFFANSGIVIASEIVNKQYFSDTNVENEKILTFGDDGDEGVLGYSVNSGLNYHIGSIAFKFEIGGIIFSKTSIFNTVNHPDISYRNSRLGIGVVYSMN